VTVLTPEDLDDVDDRLPADGARGVGALANADRTVVADAHVSARVQDAVRWTLEAHGALVRRVVVRCRLRVRRPGVQRRSGWDGNVASGTGRGVGYAAAGDAGHRLCGRRGVGCHAGKYGRRRGWRRRV